jgi:hypothetical protein
MSIRLRQIEKRMSETLADVAAALPPEVLTIRELLERLGEQGLLLACIIVALPYLIPVSLPGMSTLSGVLIALVGIALATNTVLWLPRRLLDRSLPAERFRKLLDSSAAKFKSLEHLVKPRLLWLTGGHVMNALNGGLLVYNGVLLAAPSVLPFMNTLPGVAAMTVAAGILERDGLLLIVGYVLTLAATAYFAAVAVALCMGADWALVRFGILGDPAPATAPVTP